MVSIDVVEVVIRRLARWLAGLGRDMRGNTGPPRKGNDRRAAIAAEFIGWRDNATQGRGNRYVIQFRQDRIGGGAISVPCDDDRDLFGRQATAGGRRPSTCRSRDPVPAIGAEPVHLLVDSTGEIVAAALTTNDVDDASQVGRLLEQLEGPVASLTGDGAYDQDSLYRSVMDRDPEALVIVPPRTTAVLSETAETAPTQRDRHLQCIADKGRLGWQKASGYSTRSRVEAAIGRYKQVIGDGRPSTRGRVRFHKDERRTTEVGVAVYVLNRMLELGRPISVRIA
jgi:hypothetical protein